MQKKILEIQKDIESHYKTIKKVIKLPKKKQKSHCQVEIQLGQRYIKNKTRVKRYDIIRVIADCYLNFYTTTDIILYPLPRLYSNQLCILYSSSVLTEEKHN